MEQTFALKKVFKFLKPSKISWVIPRLNPGAGVAVDSYMWTKKHDLRLEKETFFSRNHGVGSVMILGGIYSEGLTELAFLDGRQSSADYIKVIEDHFLPFGEAYYG